MGKETRIVPAILTSDPEDLAKMVRQAEAFTGYVQFDIMDGIFVPSKSIGYRDIAAVPTKLSWEAHLMVKSPEDYIAHFKDAGAQKVVFHYEATASPQKIISLAGQLGLQVGLAINPETPVDAIAGLVKGLDSMLFLTVNPGFYGSKFIPGVLDKIADFRKRWPGFRIGVDGGISEKNIKELVKAGVNDICVGSAIFMKPDPAAGYRRLQELVQEALKEG